MLFPKLCGKIGLCLQSTLRIMALDGASEKCPYSRSLVRTFCHFSRIAIKFHSRYQRSWLCSCFKYYLLHICSRMTWRREISPLAHAHTKHGDMRVKKREPWVCKLSVLSNTNDYKQDTVESKIMCKISKELTDEIMTFNDLMLSCITNLQ